MAWTTPRTWVAGEIPTAAIFNTHVRDNLNAIGKPVWAFASWPATVPADTSFRSYVSTPSWSMGIGITIGTSMTMTVPVAGYYEMHVGIRVAPGSSGLAYASLLLNGAGIPPAGARATISASADLSHGASGVSVPWVLNLTAGQFVQIGGAYSGGGTVNFSLLMRRLSDG